MTRAARAVTPLRVPVVTAAPVAAGRSSRATLVGAGLFGAAFGVAEAALVVDLRRLLYPDGFAFPLAPFPPDLLAVELAREVATLVMLLGFAWAAERRPLRRFAAFALAFGWWDLCFYAALLAFLGWPPSLLTWDLLFLVPRPWTAPVLAPVLVSVALVAAALLLLRERPDAPPFLTWRDWIVEGAAGTAVIASFLWNDAVLAAGGAPEQYPWWLFLLGWGGGLLWFGLRVRRRPRA